MAAKSMLDIAADPTKFDLRTHFYDNSGRLVKKNLYTCYVIEGQSYYERPINSGNLWSGANQPAGRVEKKFGPTGVESSKVFNFKAEHIVFTAELTGDEALHFQLEQQRNRNAQLEAELKAIQADRDPEAKKSEPLAKTMSQVSSPKLKAD